MIKVIILPGLVLIATIEEVSSELGEPDCKLVKPYVIKEYSDTRHTMEPWLSDYTRQESMMTHSSNILTIVDPKPTFIEQYNDLIK